MAAMASLELVPEERRRGWSCWATRQGHMTFIFMYTYITFVYIYIVFLPYIIILYCIISVYIYIY